MVLSERAQFDLAVRLRGEAGVGIGEVFAFVSGHYFRGKLAYALRFASPPEPGAEIAGSGALVITPTAGLRPVETRVTAEGHLVWRMIYRRLSDAACLHQPLHEA